MGDERRGLLTESERAILLGERGASDARYDAVVDRVRERIGRVEDDLDALDEHGGLADELRDVVCDGARPADRTEDADHGRRGAHPGGSPATATERDDGADAVATDADDGDDAEESAGRPNDPERGADPAPTDDAPRTSPSGGAPLADVDFPADRDREACEAAVFAARDYLREQGPASARELVDDVMPEHPLGYDVPDTAPDEGDVGPWWREVVRPGLEALPEVEAADDGEGWRYRAPGFEGGV